MTRHQAYARLGLIMALYVALAVLYSLSLPLHKAADEIAHFRYARFIAQHGRLPLTQAEREQADYKANQPPLYHALVAALTGWSDSPDPPQLKFVWESPRADLAEILLDTTRLANTIDETWPYRGAVLMWHLGRAVTILCGLGVIAVTFLTALELFPGRYRPAVISAALIAFVPAFIFYSAALSYEPLFAFIIGLYFLFLIRVVKGDTRPRNFVALGLFLGLAVMVKYAAVILPLEV
ncbi:MAG: glycosyltransferase family 39 protein, partial [Anaerolineae bacterium]|nr:glycosyltransferase family 39 protein [Anaerolineae bacterium]